MSEFSQYSWTGIIDYIKNQKLVLDKEREDWNIEKQNYLSMIQEKDSQIKTLLNEKKDLLRRIALLECSADQDSQKTSKKHIRNFSELTTPYKQHKIKPAGEKKISPVHRSSYSYGDFIEPKTESKEIPAVNLCQEFKPTPKKYWSPKLSLKSHLDSVRGVCFTSDVLISISEDRLVKLWDVSSFAAETDSFEPYATFRGHSGSILSVSYGEGIFFTADSEGFIRSWSIPRPKDIDPDGPSSSYCLTKWKGHSDSIWSVRYNSQDNALISSSSDASVKLWKIPLEYLNGSACCKSFSYPGLYNTPTVCSWVTSNMNYISVGYLSFIAVFNIETSGFSKIPFTQDSHLPNHQVNSIFCSMNTNLTITGHEDKRIRFFDLRSNQCIKDMVGHTDSVTDICVDSTGFYMLSTGHDGSLRSWDLRNFHCLHEVTLNRKKYDESVFSVALHPSTDLVAIGGSDSVVKILESKLM